MRPAVHSLLLAALLVSACHKAPTPSAGPAGAQPASPSVSAPGATAAAADSRIVRPAGAPAAAPSGVATPAPTGPAAVAAAPLASAPTPQKPTVVLTPGAAGPAPARPLASAGTLLAIGRGQSGILPEDFRIGPLGNGQSGSRDRDAAWQTAYRFLARLVAGTVDPAAITPDSRESLSDTLTYGLRQGYVPTSFRLGAPKEEADGEIAANVRLFGATGTSEGEIYLARSADAWLVADVQVNLADLAVPPAAQKERFLPSPYRWLLEE